MLLSSLNLILRTYKNVFKCNAHFQILGELVWWFTAKQHLGCLLLLSLPCLEWTRYGMLASWSSSNTSPLGDCHCCWGGSTLDCQIGHSFQIDDMNNHRKCNAEQHQLLDDIKTALCLSQPIDIGGDDGSIHHFWLVTNITNVERCDTESIDIYF